MDKAEKVLRQSGAKDGTEKPAGMQGTEEIVKHRGGVIEGGSASKNITLEQRSIPHPSHRGWWACQSR